MLEFAPEYFREENRDGFVISAFMKNAWAAQLEMLALVDRICEENDIRYFADWGTLLGAVRHGGYIPWDDDIDLCMMRDDLFRFAQAVENYDGIEISTVYNSPDHGMHAARVMNGTMFTVDRARYKEFHGFPFPAGLDIFTLDYVPRDKSLEDEQIGVLRKISDVVHTREWIEEHSPSDKGYSRMERDYYRGLKFLEDSCGMQFSQKNPTEQEILILAEEVQALYTDEDSDYLSEMPCLGNGVDYYIPKSAYSSSVRMAFENTTIPVPSGYDFVLKKKYGEEYMTPKNLAAGHDYPFYNAFIKAIYNPDKYDSIEETAEYVENISAKFYRNFLEKSSDPIFKIDDVNKDVFIETADEDMMRRRMAGYEVLAEVRRLCEQSEIPLYAVGDTLEGAALYGDYIEGADDIHLAIKREDVNRFLTMLPQELDAWYDYRSLYSSDSHADLRIYIYADKYRCDEDDFARRFHGCREQVGIDISIIDLISDDESRENVRKMLVQNLITTAQSMPDSPPYDGEILGIAEQWMKIARVDVDITGNLRREYMRAADNVGGSVRDDSAHRVRITAELQDGIDRIYERDDFAGVVNLPFGVTEIGVPCGYKNILDID